MSKILIDSDGYPKYVALCGMPQSGKSTIQKILAEEPYNYNSIDDAYPIRDFAINHFGLSHSDVYTEEGKSKTSTINGKEYTNRQILGLIGNSLETQFGENIISWLATRNLEADEKKLIERIVGNLETNFRYTFGSVRRNQGIFFKEMGGVVIEVVNTNALKGYFFDAYNKDNITHVIENDLSLGKKALKLKVHNLMQQIRKENEQALLEV